MTKTQEKISEQAAPKLPFEVKKVKAVTLPLLKQQDDAPLYILVNSKIEEGKEIKQKKGETVMEPAKIMKVVDLTTGQECEIIANTVLRSTFEENYPDDGFVGKAFEIIRHAKSNGKRYHTYSVTEIENPLA
jgi:hypothetical protein